MDSFLGSKGCSILEICNTVQGIESISPENMFIIGNHLGILSDSTPRCRSLFEVLELWDAQRLPASLKFLIESLQICGLGRAAEELKLHLQAVERTKMFTFLPEGLHDFLKKPDGERIFIVITNDAEIAEQKILDNIESAVLENKLEFILQVMRGEAGGSLPIFRCKDEDDLELIIGSTRQSSKDRFRKGVVIINKTAFTFYKQNHRQHQAKKEDKVEWKQLSYPTQKDLLLKRVLGLNGEMISLRDILFKANVIDKFDDLVDECFIIDLLKDSIPALFENNVILQASEFVEGVSKSMAKVAVVEDADVSGLATKVTLAIEELIPNFVGKNELGKVIMKALLAKANEDTLITNIMLENYDNVNVEENRVILLEILNFKKVRFWVQPKLLPDEICESSDSSESSCIPACVRKIK